MAIEWLQFAPQMGDAGDYLDQGADCAYAGKCFHVLRPVISQLWFSLPYRFGLPPATLLLLHAILLIFSIALSVNCLLVLAGRSQRAPKLQLLFTVIASAFIHIVFIKPTFFHSLTDTPAALLILCAMFLLFRAINGKKNANGLHYLFAGLLLGFSEGLRIFYLYPVLVFLALFIITSCLRGSWNWRCILLLSAAIPMLFQNFSTYVHTGKMSHFPDSTIRTNWKDFHFSSNYTGVDGLIPEMLYPWVKSPCVITDGLLVSVKDRKWINASCLIAGRAYFLLGSYSWHTYFETHSIDVFDFTLTGNIAVKKRGDISGLYTDGGLEFETSEDSAERLWQFSGLVSLKNKTVTVGVTTKFDEPSTHLKISISQQDGKIINEKLLPASLKPTRHFLHALVPEVGNYRIRMEQDSDYPSPLIFQVGDVMVTAGDAEDEFPVSQEKVRHWSIVLLVAQVLGITVLLLAAWRCTQKCPQLIGFIALPLLILAQATIIIPEQRFVIVPHVVLWMAILAAIMHCAVSMERAHRHG